MLHAMRVAEGYFVCSIEINQLSMHVISIFAHSENLEIFLVQMDNW